MLLASRRWILVVWKKNYTLLCIFYYLRVFPAARFLRVRTHVQLYRRKVYESMQKYNNIAFVVVVLCLLDIRKAANKVKFFHIHRYRHVLNNNKSSSSGNNNPEEQKNRIWMGEQWICTLENWCRNNKFSLFIFIKQIERKEENILLCLYSHSNREKTRTTVAYTIM